MKTKFILLICVSSLILLSSCAMLPAPDPTISYDDIWFAIPPVIVKRDNNYYLKYRLKLLDDINLRKVLVAKKDQGKGYYYFIGPVSSMEYGNTVERPLIMDEFVKYAETDSIYWLDPDGHETKIQIIEDNG